MSALERLLEAVIDGVPMCIAGKDCDGRYLFANLTFLEVMGTSSDELLGHHFGAFFEEPTRTRLEEHDRRVLSSGESVTEELTLLRTRACETPRTFRINKFPLRTRSGAIYGVCAVAGDVSEHRAIEADRRATEAERRAIDAERSRTLQRKSLISSLATMVAAGVPLDQLDQAACDVLKRGLEAEYAVVAERRGTHGFEVVRACGPVPLGAASEIIEQVATAAAVVPVAIAGEQFGVALPNSSKQPCVLVARLAAGQSLSEADLSFVEEIVLMLAVIRAQERQRELEQQLVRAQRLESVGKLAGGIAHDFNNLLAVILNYAAFVNEALEENQDEIRTDMREITQAAERAAELTRKLLLFARGERYSTGTCAPGEVVSDLARMLQSTVGQSLDIAVELAHTDCEVAISADELEQAAIALVVNAHDATPGGGRLTIRDELTPSELRLSFTDGGCGMTPQVLESALDPFYTTKSPGEGSGLGLSTVHGIVDRAGGKVLIESTLGSGTTVTLVLPRLVSAEVAVPDGALMPGHSSTAPTVLVVEDQEPLRDVVRRILESGGYRVVDADSAATARDVLSQSGVDIDLLLTDVLMPGENGVDLASHVTDVYAGELPVVFMSGFSDGTLAGLGADTAVNIVRKPFTREHLLEEIGVALGRRVRGPAR